MARFTKKLTAFLKLLFLVVLMPVLAQPQDEEYLGGPPLGEVPLKVSIGFNLVNITDVSEKEETMDFEGAIYMFWKDRRWAHDPAEVGYAEGDFVPGDYTRAPRKIYQGDVAVKELFEGWRLHVVIPNGVGDRVKTNMAICIWPDGMVAYVETFYAKVETPMDLRRFPFDEQKLEIFFHPFIYARDEIVLIPDDKLARTWDQNKGIAEWCQREVIMEERAVEIAYFDDRKETISELMVTVQIKRRPMHVMLSIIFPLVVLVCLTWCVFWFEEETISDRINITFIGILSVVAYYFVILDSVPQISYLILMDAFMITTFLILASGVVINLVVDKLNRRGKKALGDKVDRVCRWAFPTCYVVVTLLISLLF